MKLTDINAIINESLEDEVRRVILSEQTEDNVTDMMNAAKGFDSIAPLSNYISGLTDISDGHSFGFEVDIADFPQDDFKRIYNTSTIEEGQKILMHKLHDDLSKMGMGKFFDVDVHADESGDNLNLKIKVVSQNDTDDTDTEDESSDNTMKPTKVKSFNEAIYDAKEKGFKTISILGESYDVEECWKDIEEEEDCDECDCGEMEEQFDDFDTQIQTEEIPNPGEDYDYSSLDDAKSHFDSFNDNHIDDEFDDDNEPIIPQDDSKLFESKKHRKKKKIRVTESEMMKIINQIVAESIPGLEAVTSAHRLDKKYAEEHLNSVDKKMKDYLSFKGNDNPEFPNQIGGEKKAYNNTEKEDEYVEDNRGGGMEDLDYDHEPSEEFIERLKKSLSGHPTMGNAQNGDVTNVIPSKTGENMVKAMERKAQMRKDKPMYNKDTTPVKTVKDLGGQKTIEEVKKPNMIVKNEISRMKEMFNYINKGQ